MMPIPAVRERIHTIWDALADFDAARVDEALAYLQTSLCELIDAQNAKWGGAVRMGTALPEDKAGQPVIRALRHDEKPLISLIKQMRDPECGAVKGEVIRIVGMSGRFQVCRLCDVMSSECFDFPFFRSYYRGCGHRDGAYVAFPVNEDAESWFGLSRGAEQPPFTAEERNTLAYALRGIKWFHRQLLLSHGLLVASTPLTHVERQVLQGLLTGLAEKEIAAAQGQSFHTTHGYVGSIFRKFGVNNRAALMALWLGRAS